MARGVEMDKLEELKAKGVVSGLEFEVAKKKLVAAHDALSNRGETLQSLQAEVAELERAWLVEREEYEIPTSTGIVFPSRKKLRSQRIAFACFLLFIIFFSSLAFLIVARMVSFRGASPLIMFLPFIPVLIFGGMFALSDRFWSKKLKEYEMAERSYREQRKALDEEISRSEKNE